MNRAQNKFYVCFAQNLLKQIVVELHEQHSGTEYVCFTQMLMPQLFSNTKEMNANICLYAVQANVELPLLKELFHSHFNYKSTEQIWKFTILFVFCSIFAFSRLHTSDAHIVRLINQKCVDRAVTDQYN